MGAGRKTSTYDYDTKAAKEASAQSFEQRQRNLGEQLGGCIFGCTNETMEECLTDKVFGLPRPHWCYVQWIAKGMPIFLFNYSNRKLHGIFRAASDGEWEIKPDGWCKGVGTKTQYPSQVKVELYAECEPLTDREYKQILASSWSEDGHLLFELKKTEAQNLCRAFDEKTNGRRSGGDRPMPSATGASTAHAQANMKPFRPASPPALPAWGSTAAEAAPKTLDLSRKASADSKASGQAMSQELAKISNTGASKAAGGSIRPEPSVKDASQKSRSGADTAAQKAPVATAKVPSKAAQTVTPSNPSPGNPGPLAADKGKATLGQTVADMRNAQNAAASSSGPTQVAADDGWGPATVPESSNWGAKEQPSKEARGPATKAQPNGQQSQRKEVPAPQHGASQQAQGNGHAEAAAAPSTGADDEFYNLLDSMHAATRKLDQTAADGIWHLFKTTRDRLQQATEERIILARVADTFKKEKTLLENLVKQQTHAIEVLKEEARSLRRDLAFVGKHVNINVAPDNPALEALQPLPALTEQTPAATSAFANGTARLSSAFQTEALLMFGGNNSAEWVETMDSFVPAKKQWTVLGHMPQKRGYGAAAAMSGHVYLMGGGTGSEWYDSCNCYDVPTNQWFQMSPMQEPKGSLAAVALGGRVYATGGGTTGVQSKTMEILDPNINTWMRGKDMHLPRFATAAAVIGESIYVVGGFDGRDGGSGYLVSAERHDPREGVWEKLPEMQHKRGGHAVVAVAHEMYTMAGWDSEEFLDSVEVYDVRANAWRAAAPLKTPHAYFAAAYLDGSIYALGGMCSKSEFNELVEQYDVQANKWSAVYMEPASDECARKRAFVAACKL